MKDTSFWAVLHTGIWDHPKMVALCVTLSLSEETAAGILTRLQHAGLVHAIDGVFRGWSREAVERALHISSATSGMIAGRAIDGLIEAGFAHEQGGDIHIHGWADYTGVHLTRMREKREADAKRKRDKRASPDVQRTDPDVPKHPPDTKGRPAKSSLSGKSCQGSHVRDVRDVTSGAHAETATDTEHSLIGGWKSKDEEQTDPDPAPSHAPPESQEAPEPVSLRTTRPPPRGRPASILSADSERVWPETLEALLALPEVLQLRQRYPAYTETGRAFEVPGCKTWIGAVTVFWVFCEKARLEGRPRYLWKSEALSKLDDFLNGSYGASARAFEAAKRSGTAPPPPADPQADPRLKQRPTDWDDFRNGYFNRTGHKGKHRSVAAWVAAGRPYSDSHDKEPTISDEEMAENRQRMRELASSLTGQKTIKGSRRPGGDQ